METTTDEIWITINSFPNYAVSNIGKVKRIANPNGTRIGHILKPYINNCGYGLVRLCTGKRKSGKWKFIHQLVLEHFQCPRPDGMTVNHKDGNKQNNHLSNLEWVTVSENFLHAFRLGLKKSLKGTNHPRALFKEGEVWLMRRLYLHGVSQKHIALMFMAKSQRIHKIVRMKCYCELNCYQKEGGVA